MPVFQLGQKEGDKSFWTYIYVYNFYIYIMFLYQYSLVKCFSDMLHHTNWNLQFTCIFSPVSLWEYPGKMKTILLKLFPYSACSFCDKGFM